MGRKWPGPIVSALSRFSGIQSRAFVSVLARVVDFLFRRLVVPALVASLANLAQTGRASALSPQKSAPRSKIDWQFTTGLNFAWNDALRQGNI